MPLDTQSIEFAAERERLHEQMLELAEEQAELDDTTQRANDLLQLGNELNNQRNILDHLSEEWDVDGVSLAGLTAGEVNRVEDTVDGNPGVRERDAWVAIGTREAPYLEHDPDAITQAEFEETVANVVELPLPYVRWAEGRISELSHLAEESGNGYLDLVRAKRDDQTETNG
jgi:hypothetical protein